MAKEVDVSQQEIGGVEDPPAYAGWILRFLSGFDREEWSRVSEVRRGVAMLKGGKHDWDFIDSDLRLLIQHGLVECDEDDIRFVRLSVDGIQHVKIIREELRSRP